LKATETIQRHVISTTQRPFIAPQELLLHAHSVNISIGSQTKTVNLLPLTKFNGNLLQLFLPASPFQEKADLEQNLMQAFGVFGGDLSGGRSHERSGFGVEYGGA